VGFEPTSDLDGHWSSRPVRALGFTAASAVPFDGTPSSAAPGPPAVASANPSRPLLPAPSGRDWLAVPPAAEAELRSTNASAFRNSGPPESAWLSYAPGTIRTCGLCLHSHSAPARSGTCRLAKPAFPGRGAPRQPSHRIISLGPCACSRVWTGGTLGAPAGKLSPQTSVFQIEIGSVTRLCPAVAGQSHRSNSMVRKGSTVRVR
jgi:hypothetical protein